MNKSEKIYVDEFKKRLEGNLDRVGDYIVLGLIPFLYLLFGIILIICSPIILMGYLINKLLYRGNENS